MKHLSVILCLFGIAICAMFALGLTPDFCQSQGCNFTKNVAVYGISLYWFGALYFSICSLIIYLELDKKFPITKFAILAGFAGEVVLLSWQNIFFTCLSCYMVAGLIALLSIIKFKEYTAFLERTVVIAFLTIFVITGANIFLSDNTRLEYGAKTANADIVVYFNPSSINNPDFKDFIYSSTDESVSYIPIVENEGDIAHLIRLDFHISNGKTYTQALLLLNEESETISQSYSKINLITKASYLIRSFSNSVTATLNGYKKLPIIINKTNPFNNLNQKTISFDLDFNFL